MPRFMGHDWRDDGVCRCHGYDIEAVKAVWFSLPLEERE